MNNLIRRGASPRRNHGLIAGQDTPAAPSSELAAATEELERARQANDDMRIHAADHRIERLLDQARAAGQQQKPPAPNFDGGVRRQVQEPPTMNDLIRDVSARL